MSNQRYPEEFKIEAVKQVTERGLRVADVAERLGVSAHSLYAWVERYSKPQAQRQQVDDQQAELRRLGAFYRRLSARIGKAKAVTATARKIAILFYNAMRFGMAYQDPGADHYEQKYRERVVKGLHRRAAEFGFTLQTVEGVS